MCSLCSYDILRAYMNTLYPSERLFFAINTATQLHRNQIRKDKEQTPYISHLFSVMTLLSSVTSDEDVLIAGLLHDVLEDVAEYSKEKLQKDFGERVYTYVSFVTEELDPHKEMGDQVPWLTRKENYIQKLRLAKAESILISLADKIHNLSSIKYALETGDTELFSKFNGSFANQLFFYEAIISIGEKHLGDGHPFVIRIKSLVQEITVLTTRDQK